MGLKLNLLAVVACVVLGVAMPRLWAVLDLLDVFKDPFVETPNAKNCCHIIEFGDVSLDRCATQRHPQSPSGETGFTREGFEDVIYVKVPLPDSNQTMWGGLACAGDLRRIFHDKAGPDSVPDGVCALMLYDGSATLRVVPVPLRNFPHLLLAFHPHGIYRTVVGDARPLNGFPPTSEVPHPHEDASQRIYIVNHGYGRGDEAVLVFRLTFFTPPSPGDGPLVELYYEGDISHPSFGLEYRGSFNDLYVDDEDPNDSAVIISTFTRPADSLRGKANPETWGQRLHVERGMLSAIMDSFETTVIRCPFREVDLLTRGSVSSTSAEEEEDDANPAIRQVSHAQVDFDTSSCQTIATNIHANGVAGTKLVLPARGEQPEKVFTVVLVVDISRHQLLGMVATTIQTPQSQSDLEKGPQNQTFVPFMNIRLRHSADNIELDPTSALDAAVRDGRENTRELKLLDEKHHLYGIRDLRFFLGSIPNSAEALKLFSGSGQKASGGLLELTLSLEYDPNSEAQQGAPPIRLAGVVEKDLVLHDGADLSGTSSGIVLGEHPAGKPNARTPIALLGSYFTRGLLACPLTT